MMTDGTGTTSYAYHPVDGGEAKPRRGAHAPLRVVFGALAEDRLVRPYHAVSDGGVGNDTRGRVCSPRTFTGTGAAKTWVIAYDKADQLEAATQTQGATVTAQQAFRFDRIGNITSKQDGSEISKGTFNNRNQLTAREPGGWMRVRGTTSEGASVKVKSNANPFTNAATTSADEFSAWVQAVPGANTVTVEAKDDSPNANTRTQSWSVNITGQSRVPGYDLNGNMTANGLGQTYSWDAENRLVKITYADNSKTEFTYDGLSRRVRITERNASNTITSDKRYLWAGGNQPAEEREANGTTVTKRYFPQGEQRIGGADAGFYYYTKDHLGSVREITNSSGALATRYDFDLWGKRTKLSDTLDSEVGFTGHHHHAKSGLVLTWFRAYDADAGRWLSLDPFEEDGGTNLYAYVENYPLGFIDLLGLQARPTPRPAPGTPGGPRVGPVGSPGNPFVFTFGSAGSGGSAIPRTCPRAINMIWRQANTPTPQGSSPNQGHSTASVNMAEAMAMGYRWVGANAIPIYNSHNGTLAPVGYRNADGSRIWRFPTAKNPKNPALAPTGVQMNLEMRCPKTGQRTNTHVNVRALDLTK